MPLSSHTSRGGPRASKHTPHARPPVAKLAAMTSGRDDDHDYALPPAKRRKLSIRPSGKQTTLEKFILPHAAVATIPPTKLSRTEPHGQLVESINGARNVLDIDDDDLSVPTTRPPSPAIKSAAAAATVAPVKHTDKRSLRSHDDGPKLKSELAIYFPNYDEIILDPPKEDEFINIDSAIYISDEAAKPQKSEQTSPVKSPKTTKGSPFKARASFSHGSQVPSTPQKSLSNQFNGSPTLNLDFVAKTLPDNPVDPLTDDFYLKSHRRAERKEKQLRNIEKERAMHEKVQLDRLLDGLLGHDWLRVMGITAVTDLEARKYEPKRDYFVAEVQFLVEKFKQWREQEKKQKLQKDAASAAAREVTEDRESDEGSIGPPSSDLNASAALQLQQETAIAIKHAAAAAAAARTPKGKDTAAFPATPPVPLPPPPPEVPMTSFYAKRHLRDAALGKARHGRNVTAFGHPVPDLDEEEFRLPEDYVTQDTLRANARERRRRKRASAVDGGAA